MKSRSKTQRSSEKAFSMLELLVALVVVGIFASLAITGTGDITESSSAIKLDSDVRTVNSAIRVYLANGGDFEEAADPHVVISKMKTTRDGTGEFAGLRESMIDKRLVAIEQTDQEAADSSIPRAIWNSASMRFEVKKSTSKGIARFELNEALALVDFGKETRKNSAIDYNIEDGWIWTFEDTAALAIASPTTVSLSKPAPQAPTTSTDPSRLATPTLSLPGGGYQPNEWPLSVSITNHNSTSISALFYSLRSSGASNWQPYSGSITLAGPDTIYTYAKSSGTNYINSFTTGAEFELLPVPLQAPEIAPSADVLDIANGSPVEITLNDQNPEGIPSELQYRLDGGTWLSYADPFNLTVASAGEIEARSMAITTGYIDSPISSRNLQIRLQAPEITLSATGFAPSVPTIDVSMSNPNPAGSSALTYQIIDTATASQSSWVSYNGSFTLQQADHPEGFEVAAYAEASSSLYINSDETTDAASFFGIPVNGKTVFVIDSSGSMAGSGKLDAVKAELNAALSNYPTNGEFAVIDFSNSANTVFGWSQATPSNVASAIAAINALSPEGSTDYSSALDQALGILSGNDVEQVIFLSDGKPTIGDSSTAGLLSRASSIASAGATLDTIGFFLNSEGQELLQQMANSGNGSHSQVN